MTSHPQTDGIKLFVLCRESRDMVSWVDPTFTLERRHSQTIRSNYIQDAPSRLKRDAGHNSIMFRWSLDLIYKLLRVLYTR
jgi:hypothetical protein